MGHSTNDTGLDKSSRERLAKLAEASSTPHNKSWGHETLRVADLQLLLTHHQPLQELIRTVAQGTGTSIGTDRALANSQNASADLDDADTGRKTTKSKPAAPLPCPDCTQAQTELQVTLRALTECTSTVRTIQAELQTKSQTIQRLETQLREAHAELARSQQTAPELALLRSDPALAKELGLANLPEQAMPALVQAVAVLSQRDNLERLWNALKDRCEEAQRTANPDELDLLKTALGWHNVNWPQKPFVLQQPKTQTAYNFEQHQRSRHTTSGETIAQVQLPGITNGSGKPLCKTLVNTL